MTSPANSRGAAPLALVGPELRATLEAIDVAIYVLDVDGIIRWANRAAKTLIGHRVGESYLNSIAHEHRRLGKTILARMILGGAATVITLTIVTDDDQQVDLRFHSAPLRHSETVVGIVGIALRLDATTSSRSLVPRGATSRLTPRQFEVLCLLADGLSTKDIAARLGIAVETARNHIRRLLRALGVHSRLEAVAEARRQGFVRQEPE
jgi:PAS domain S-box-containing protein